MKIDSELNQLLSKFDLLSTDFQQLKIKLVSQNKVALKIKIDQFKSTADHRKTKSIWTFKSQKEIEAIQEKYENIQKSIEDVKLKNQQLLIDKSKLSDQVFN